MSQTIKEELESYNRGVRAALRWAAELVKAEGCPGCQVAITPSRYRPAGEDPREHGPHCPIAVAAKILKGSQPCDVQGEKP